MTAERRQVSESSLEHSTHSFRSARSPRPSLVHSGNESEDDDAASAWRSVQTVLSTRRSSIVDDAVSNHASPYKTTIANGLPITAEPSTYDESDASDEEHSLTSEDPKSRLRHAAGRPLRWHERLPRLSLVQKRILKCAISYLIASAFTFIDPLSDLVSSLFAIDSPVANAHFIATVAVYYNPGKTNGEMVEADLFLTWAGLFSLLVCFGSMGTAVGINREGVEWLSHLVVVIIWLAGSMGILAYTKNRVGKATFGSACSMTALINSVIICKEGAVHLGVFETDAILQMGFIVIVGALISNLVCFTLWPESSTSILQENVCQTLSAFAELIQLLSRTFLLDENAVPLDGQIFKSAIETHEAAFTALKESLDAAKLELLDSRIESCHEAYDAIVASMTRLAQHTSGLRSGCTLQIRLQQARRDGLLEWPPSADVADRNRHPDRLDKRLLDSARTFASFGQSVGHSLRHLTTQCKDAFKELRSSFMHSDARTLSQTDSLEEGSSVGVLEKIKVDLAGALGAFERDHNRALKRLYKQLPTDATISNSNSFLEQNLRPVLDISKANEDIFELYFFLFNLEELVHELIHLVDAFVVVRSREDHLAAANHGGGRRGSRASLPFAETPAGRQLPFFSRLRAKSAILKSRFSLLLPYSKTSSPFPKMLDNASSHWSQRQNLPFLQRSQRTLWQRWQSVKKPDILFAIKVGVGGGILGTPAFIDATRDIFVKWRGEWAMISYMVVVATTVGQTNFNTVMRILGTILGALVAIGAYHVLNHYPFLLAMFGFAFSIPNFWLVVTRPKWATTGRFILLAYNLTALYSYNMREIDLHVGMVAVRRSTAVMAGSIWAWAVTTLIWPYEARRELRNGLCDLLLNSAWLYEKLVRAYSTPPKDLIRSSSSALLASSDETTSLLTPAARRHLNSAVDDFVEMELHLQRQLIHLNSLLTQTSHEYRLKGPFPAPIYRRILGDIQAILDQLHAMRCVTTREAWYTTVRRQFIIPVQKERRAMVGCIILTFSIVASSIRLKAPLPPYMPPAEEARKRLMDTIRELPVVKRRVVHRADQLLYFAYAATMSDVIERLESLADECKTLFGIISGRSVEDFEDLFSSNIDDEHGEDVADSTSSSEG